jgi:hypothetical protein
MILVCNELVQVSHQCDTSSKRNRYIQNSLKDIINRGGFESSYFGVD